MALIAQYLFNGNCNSSTGSYNGTGSRMNYRAQPNGTNFGSGVALFDGWSNSSRTSISFPSYSFNSTWSIETWYRREQPGNTDYFFHAGTNYGNYQLLHIGINNSNKLRIGFYNTDLEAPGTYTDSNWHHLVFTYNHSTKARQIFCDGVLVASDTASSALNATSTWYIGWYNNNQNFCGELANLRIWNEVLSDATIASHYNSEKGDVPMKSYNYTGSIQTFTAPVSGYYKLETWGAAAGGSTSYVGGFGGYSVGVVHLQKDAVLHIGVGQLGTSVTTTRTTASATFNGGGAARTSEYSGSVAGAGGGATHIATASGELKDLVSNQSSVLIVSGGGGGGHYLNGVNYGQGGQGGGFNGAGGTGYASDNNSDPRRRSGGGTQTAGGTTANGDLPGGFGYGGNGTASVNGIGSGGGGGWYGGSGCLNGPGGGGSGYIASDNLLSYGGITKHMTGYNVASSSSDSTRTQSNTSAHYVATSDSSMRVGGIAQITLVEQDPTPTSDFNTAALLLMMV